MAGSNARSASVQIAGRLSYREQLERMWRARPEMGVREARQLTGAPKQVVETVRQRLVRLGVLKGGRLWD